MTTEQDQTRKVLVYLPENLHRRLKVYAAQTDRSMSEITATVLQVFLDQMERAKGEKR